jgi:hypothetical protein
VREVVHALLCMTTTGCEWRQIPMAKFESQAKTPSWAHLKAGALPKTSCRMSAVPSKAMPLPAPYPLAATYGNGQGAT